MTLELGFEDKKISVMGQMGTEPRVRKRFN